MSGDKAFRRSNGAIKPRFACQTVDELRNAIQEMFETACINNNSEFIEQLFAAPLLSINCWEGGTRFGGPKLAPLHVCARHGHVESIRAIIQIGQANVNTPTENGSTALMIASEHNKLDVVKALCEEFGADQSKQDVEGNTALERARNAQMFSIVNYFEYEFPKVPFKNEAHSAEEVKQTLEESSVRPTSRSVVGTTSISFETEVVHLESNLMALRKEKLSLMSRLTSAQSTIRRLERDNKTLEETIDQLQCEKEQAPLVVVQNAEVEESKSTPSCLRTSYTYEELKTKTFGPNVDRRNLHNYLNDADFVAVFNMDRGAFDGLPQWKQVQLKKSSHLF